MRHRNIELAMVLIATLTPMFLFRARIMDEDIWRGGTGIAAGVTVFAAYRMWQSYRRKREDEENGNGNGRKKSDHHQPKEDE